MKFLALFILAASTLFAQEAAADTDFVGNLIISLATQYPVLVTVLSAVGALRLLVKPIMSFLHQRAEATETKDDDLRLKKIESSWWFKLVAFGLDYLASVKVQKPAKPIN
jgi:hypothetical protein